jgi:NADH:ubiquinone oxidoreductase subunit 5 (subunit L)/multisubunit Na+/H+ antiporter MnhA subunit
VNLSFQADQPRCLLVLAGSLLLLLNVSQPQRSKRDNSAAAIFLFPLSVVAILATDLAVLASVWIMTDFCVVRLLTGHDGSETPGKRSLNTAEIIRSSSALLLFATLMAVARFGTSDLELIIGRSVEDGRVDAVTVVAGLSVLFAGAIAIRCAIFPALIWPRTYLQDRPDDAGIVVVLAGILPGISLAVATLPFCEVSADTFMLLGMLGILTCFTATGIALVQDNSNRVATLLSVSAAGLAVSAMATSSLLGGQLATCTLLAQLVAIFVLQRCGEVSSRKIGFGMALLVAVSGIGGSNAILSLVELSLHDGSNSASTASADQFLLLIWWGIVVSQILWGIAIVKLVMIEDSSALRRAVKAPKLAAVTGSRHGSIVLAIVAAMALGACVVPVGGSEIVEATGLAESTTATRLFTFGAATPACLLGVVAAWLLAHASENVRSTVVSKLDSLARLSREWFYLEDAIRCVVVWPVRGLAMAIEICDRKILGGTLELRWEKVPTCIASSIEHLRFQPAIYYGLTGVLLVVGLLWSLG